MFIKGPSDGAVLELRSRSGGNKIQESVAESSESNGVSCVDRPLQEGDTLQKIALQYSIPVAELKRLNNLINEQDLFGKAYIRIPAKQYVHKERLLIDDSLRTAEALKNETGSNASDLFLPLSDEEDGSNQAGTSSILRSTSPNSEGSGTTEHIRDYRKMIKNVDASLKKAKTATNDYEERDEYDEDAIFNGDMHNFLSYTGEPDRPPDPNLGRYLIGVLIVFGVVGMVGYLIYAAITAEK